jgi:hypothetical protein
MAPFREGTELQLTGSVALAATPDVFRTRVAGWLAKYRDHTN